ncbi:uncharacterized protein LOC143468667 [Clavelina lepadiformis]|uniref:uncharacterized protein LOC143468667 n=1 Tax=Clavelina lepadiformis TaxID=159417 RepID=UPI0040430FED
MRIYHLVISVCMSLNVLCYGKQRNESSKDEVCPSNHSDACQEGIQEKEYFTPFKYETSQNWVALEKVFPLYTAWHNRTLENSGIPCNEKKSLVFTPNAGLGDSIGALTSAFTYAVKTGRLFFIDWQPYEWTVGLKTLPFNFDYGKVTSLKDPFNDEPLICDHDKASFLTGHATQQHAVVNEPVVNDIYFSYEHLAAKLLQPSPKVKRIVDEVVNSRLQPSGKIEGGYLNRSVAIVMRTGNSDYVQFLSEDDEMNFVKCFRNYANIYVKKQPSQVRFRVFVTSDSETVKERVVDELENGDNGDVTLEVVTLDDSIIHVMHVEEKSKRKKSVRDKIRKTYAEFFLIGRCEVLFLTHGSLFGRAASDRGVAKESDVHFISDSKCDGKREKYSYLQCHEPKYPKVCGFD